MGWYGGPTPSTAPKSLTYRLIASLLNHKVNDRELWRIKPLFLRADGSDDAAFAALVPGLPGAIQHLEAKESSRDRPAQPAWLVMRGDTRVAALTIQGGIYAPGHTPTDLNKTYATRHRLDDVLSQVLDLL